MGRSSTVAAGATVGGGCVFGAGVQVDAGARIGERVVIGNNVHVHANVTLGDDVRIGSNVSFAQEPDMRRTTVDNASVICAGATLASGVTVGLSARVEPGSVVVYAVPDNTVVSGNPARHSVHLNASKAGAAAAEEANAVEEIEVHGVEWQQLFTNVDHRGSLSVAEYAKQLPFRAERVFLVYGVPMQELRGYHAHHTTHEFLVCVRGSVAIMFDDGTVRQEIVLNNPARGILMRPLVWCSQHYLSDDAILLVICNETFKPESYIRDYRCFMSAVAAKRGAVARGASGVAVPFLNVREMIARDRTRLVRAFESVLDTSAFIGGDQVAQFEERWARFCGTKHAVGLGSGLAALHLMLVAVGVGPGDEVIMPANTFIATLLAVSMAGGTVVLVDADAATRNIDVTKVAAAITPRTKVILPVDLYGMPAPVPALQEIADAHGVLLLVDAAQSHGAMVDGRRSGGRVLASTYSFYPGKNLGALGDAGAMVTNDDALADKVRVLRNYGSRVRYVNEVKGVNERLDTVQAALLMVRLDGLEAGNQRRQEIAAAYRAGMAGVRGLTLPGEVDGVVQSWHLFVVQCEARDALAAHLAECNVGTGIHYPIPPHMSDAYAELPYSEGDFPVTEHLARTVLSLPVCPTMSDEQVAHVISSVKSFFPA